jgi:hypothetical protein
MSVLSAFLIVIDIHSSTDENRLAEQQPGENVLFAPKLGYRSRGNAPQFATEIPRYFSCDLPLDGHGAPEQLNQRAPGRLLFREHKRVYSIA